MTPESGVLEAVIVLTEAELDARAERLARAYMAGTYEAALAAEQYPHVEQE